MNTFVSPAAFRAVEAPGAALVSPVEIPQYLWQYYDWAYVHPHGIRRFDRAWVTNLILWGNFPRLRDAAVAGLGDPIAGRTLQVACVYGDFTQKLVRRLSADSWLDVVDVVPDQLENLAAKLSPADRVGLHRCDAMDLPFEDAAFDRIMLFFLLHEQPRAVRSRSLAEAWRVLRPGGRLVLVDYHRPAWWHPLRYLFGPVLRKLEPFAQDLWDRDVATWMPDDAASAPRAHRLFFGRLYQMLTIDRPTTTALPGAV